MGKEFAWEGYFQSEYYIYIPININNQHWTCIVIFMKEKQIQYYDYDSNSVGAGKRHMDIILKYLVNEDRRQHHIKRDE
jgi:Ulp1 family protease